jgi:hypothetical protein
MLDLTVKPHAAIERTEAIRARAAALIEGSGWTQSEAARRCGVPNSTLSEFLRGHYKGNKLAIADKLERWLATEDARLETDSAVIADPGFVETSAATQVIQALTFAQSGPSMALITMGSGLGKTMALQWYQANRLHAFRVAIEPVDARPQRALRKIAATLGLYSRSRSLQDTQQEIMGRLKGGDGRKPLLMVDEAQHLTEDAVNQLRFLLDEARCGLALCGNEDLMTRYSLSATREGYGQIHRRVGMRVHILKAPPGDVDRILDALAITDADMRRLAHQIAARPGSLGQVVDTLKLASLIAYGAGRSMTPGDVRQAWQNRSREELR